MNVPALLKKHRLRLKWTQQQVAERLFVSRNTYTQYENGTRKIDTETFFRLVAILKIDVTINDYLTSDIRLRELANKQAEWETQKANLFEAIAKDDVERVRWFVENGFAPDTKDETGTSAFLCAVLHDAHQTVRYLLKKGTPYAVPHEQLGILPLCIAVAAGHTETVRMLLEEGTDPNETTEDGTPCLWLAVRTKNVPIFTLLMESGADINIKAPIPNTPSSEMERNVFVDAYSFYISESIARGEAYYRPTPKESGMLRFIASTYGNRLDEDNVQTWEELKGHFQK